MLVFIKNNWTEILSIVGAAAWLPIIISPIMNHFQKIQATVLDFRCLSNGKSTSALEKKQKNGTILMLVLNLFVKKITVFARNISVSIYLKNNARLSTELLDFSTTTSNNDYGTTSTFDVPIEQEMNISRTINPGVDNIKYVALLVENTPTLAIDEIDKIEIRLFYTNKQWNFFSKKIVLTAIDFPAFNSSKLIQKVEKYNYVREEGTTGEI